MGTGTGRIFIQRVGYKGTTTRTLPAPLTSLVERELEWRQGVEPLGTRNNPLGIVFRARKPGKGSCPYLFYCRLNCSA